MNIMLYKKSKRVDKKKIFRILGVVITLAGICVTVYVFLPVLIWMLILQPAFASQSLAIPIPKSALLSPANIKNMMLSQASIFTGIDYSHASNWFPAYVHSAGTPRIPHYEISIPRLNIQHAQVSTIDDDLSHHLVNFQGTCVPPEKGNCVIFGHSTLPQLYNPNNYKTIFANIQNLRMGDVIIVKAENIEYTYKIFSMIVVNPDDTSVLAQSLDDSYLTIITCTPPGTVWERLVIKSRLVKL